MFFVVCQRQCGQKLPRASSDGYIIWKGLLTGKERRPAKNIPAAAYNQVNW